jgi:hypothetical protein
VERYRFGAILLALGALLLVLSALADPIGIGEGGGIGWKQIVGMVVGAAAIVFGALLMRAKRGESTSAAVDV